MKIEPQSKYEYLALSEKDLLWDSYITGIGSGIIPGNCDYPPGGHPELYNFTWEKGRVLPEYHIVMISQGSGYFDSMETGLIEFRAPAAFLLLPGTWHRYKPESQTGWTEHWVSLNGEYLFRLARRNVFSATEPFFENCQLDELIQIHNKMWDHLQKSSLSNSPILTTMGLELLAHIIESRKAANQPIDPSHSEQHVTDPLVAQALHEIWSHSHRNISVEQIVKQLPVTRRTLERKFNEQRGHCIGKELLLCRLARAKHMLTATSLPIEHIALASGFSGADRLGKTLRQFENMTPSQYRKKNR